MNGLAKQALPFEKLHKWAGVLCIVQIFKLLSGFAASFEHLGSRSGRRIKSTDFEFYKSAELELTWPRRQKKQ